MQGAGCRVQGAACIARTAIRVREATKGVHILVEGLGWRGEGVVNERPRLARALHWQPECARWHLERDAHALQPTLGKGASGSALGLGLGLGLGIGLGLGLGLGLELTLALTLTLTLTL